MAPYALVAVAVFTAAFGAPVLTRLCAVVLATYAGNAVFGECDLASWALGDAPRSAYRGKTVWITGASQGLGEELALHLGSMGAKLILSSRREETLRRVCEAATAAGAADARALTLDARAGSAAMREKGAAALALAKDMAGAGDGVDGTDADIGVDYLFHVAGGSQHAAAEDTADEVDRDMFELNHDERHRRSPKPCSRRCSRAGRAPSSRSDPWRSSAPPRDRPPTRRPRRRCPRSATRSAERLRTGASP